jgi:hypothetical protein
VSPEPGGVDLRPAKEAARRLLPAGNPFRVALLQEPDWLPPGVAQDRIRAYLRLALAMRGTKP